MRGIKKQKKRDLRECSCEGCGSHWDVLFDNNNDEYICEECLEKENRLFNEPEDYEELDRGEKDIRAQEMKDEETYRMGKDAREDE